MLNSVRMSRTSTVTQRFSNVLSTVTGQHPSSELRAYVLKYDLSAALAQTHHGSLLDHYLRHSLWFQERHRLFAFRLSLLKPADATRRSELNTGSNMNRTHSLLGINRPFNKTNLFKVIVHRNTSKCQQMIKLMDFLCLVKLPWIRN